MDNYIEHTTKGVWSFILVTYNSLHRSAVTLNASMINFANQYLNDTTFDKKK